MITEPVTLNKLHQHLPPCLVLQESDPGTFLAQGFPRLSNSDDANHFLNWSWGIFVLAILALPFAKAFVFISRFELHADPAKVVLEFVLGLRLINSLPNEKYDVKSHERITNRKPQGSYKPQRSMSL